MKKCRICNDEKEDAEFNKCSHNSDGLNSYCKICDTKRVKQWKKDNPEKLKSQKKRRHLKESFGITFKEYTNMYSKQQGKCAICQKELEEGERSFSVDHSHITNEIRGLLCTNCNSGLGHFKDDVNILEKAIKYLENGGFVQ